MQKKIGRMAELDGVRGIAAFIVVIFHFFTAYMPSLMPQQTNTPLWITDTPLGIFYNGSFAVSVFFVLSGFVIANSAANSKSPLIVNFVLRYIRLAFPATFSVLYAWALLKLMPNEATKLKLVLPHAWLQFTYQDQIPGLLAALYDGLIGIFRTGQSQFNNVLWTMKIELVGSLLLYVLYVVKKEQIIVPVLLVSIILIRVLHLKLSSEGFVFGALLREAYARDKLPSFLPIPIFLLGVLLGSEATGFDERIGLPVAPRILRLGNAGGIIYPIAAAMIVYGVLASAKLKGLFAAAVPRFLGRISFSLYLVHVPLLYTIFSAFYLTLVPTNVISMTALFIIFASASLLIGCAVTLSVDEPTLALIARIRSRFKR